MTAQQLNMLTQMVSQNRPSTQSTKNNDGDDTSFKNMFDDKKQENTSVKDETVKGETVKEDTVKNEVQASDKEEDIASKQALLANLLFAQSTTPIQNEMSQQNTNVSAEQIIQPVVENQMVENMQNIQNVSDNQNIINTQNMDNSQNVQTQQIDVQVETQDVNELNIKPEVKNETNGNVTEVSQPKTEVVNDNAKSTVTDDSAKDMMQSKTSKTDTEQPQVKQTEVQVETPLFQNVENTPVKVGETTPVLDTQSPNVEQDLQDIIKYNLKADGDKVEIQLNPSNLGKITIELVQKDGSMSVLVTAENSKTLSLLAQHAGGIETMMQERLSQPVHVFIEQQQQQQFNDNQNHNNQQNQNNQNNENNKPSKDEQQNFIDQLRLGLYQLG